MANYTLLRYQKLQVAEILKSESLDGRQFDWVDKASSADTVSMLRYRPLKQYYFTFDAVTAENRIARFAPAKDQLESGDIRCGAFEQQLRVCKLWASYLKRELDTPDWNKLFEVEGTDARGVLGDTGDAPFSKAEVRSISEHLSALHADLVRQRQLSQEQSLYVRSEFRSLEEAASRLGRKEWKTIAMGTAVNIALYLAQPETGSWLMKGLLGLWTALHGGPPLPQVP